MAAVGAWLVPWVPYARVGAWPVPWAVYGRRGVVTGSLGPSGRRRFVAGFLVSVLPPWGRGRSPGPRLAAVGSWVVTWAPSGRHWGVAGPLGPVWPPWGVAGLLISVWPPWGRGPSIRPRLAALGAWPVL